MTLFDQPDYEVVRDGKTIIITISKSRRRFGGRNQYRWKISGANHKTIATGETYANIADLARTVRLLTGVAVPAILGEHIVGFTVAGAYVMSSRY